MVLLRVCDVTESMLVSGKRSTILAHMRILVRLADRARSRLIRVSRKKKKKNKCFFSGENAGSLIRIGHPFTLPVSVIGWVALCCAHITLGLIVLVLARSKSLLWISRSPLGTKSKCFGLVTHAQMGGHGCEAYNEATGTSSKTPGTVTTLDGNSTTGPWIL